MCDRRCKSSWHVGGNLSQVLFGLQVGWIPLQGFIIADRESIVAIVTAARRLVRIPPEALTERVVGGNSVLLWSVVAHPGGDTWVPLLLFHFGLKTVTTVVACFLLQAQIVRLPEITLFNFWMALHHVLLQVPLLLVTCRTVFTPEGKLLGVAQHVNSQSCRSAKGLIANIAHK